MRQTIKWYERKDYLLTFIHGDNSDDEGGYVV